MSDKYRHDSDGDKYLQDSDGDKYQVLVAESYVYIKVYSGYILAFTPAALDEHIAALQAAKAELLKPPPPPDRVIDGEEYSKLTLEFNRLCRAIPPAYRSEQGERIKVIANALNSARDVQR